MCPQCGSRFWPGAGIRLDDTLIVFGGILRQEGAPGPDRFAHPYAYGCLDSGFLEASCYLARAPADRIDDPTAYTFEVAGAACGRPPRLASGRRKHGCVSGRRQLS